MSNAKLNQFLPYQWRWIMDDTRTAMAEKSRRVGFTFAHAYRSVERRIKLGTDEYFASRDKESAGLYLDDVKTFAKLANVVAEDLGEQVINEKKNLTAFVVRLDVPGRARQAKIMALSSNPEVFRSKGGDITLDEFAFHANPRKVLKSANASAKIWGHQVRIISTHNGETNLFNVLAKEIRDGKRRWALHTVTLQSAVDQGLVEKIQRRAVVDPAARAAFIDEVRNDCIDQSEWDEEYCCLPSSEANVLLSYDLIGACERDAASLPIVDDPTLVKFDGPIYGGLDIGRERDLTVFWLLGKRGDVYETLLIKTFDKTPWHIQEDYGHMLFRVLPNLQRLCGDATGIGDMLCEAFSRKWGQHRAEKIKFTNEVKADLAMPFVRLFQDRLVRVPADPLIREDLHKVRKIVTSAGNVRYDARSDDAGHADRFWAAALAYHAADDSVGPVSAPLAFKPRGW